MQLTARQLNRTTLHRQLLLKREPLDVVAAVRHLVGLQAQQAAGPYLALWNRISDFDAADLDAAFADHRIVKASLLRITLHAVAIEDHPVWRSAVLRSLRGSRLGDRRFTGTGLKAVDADTAEGAVLAHLSKPRSNADVEAFVAERLPGVPAKWLWWALRTCAPLIHAPGDHPWTFGHRPAYLAAPSTPYEGDAASALVELTRRCLAAYGPASAADLAQFATLERGPVKSALARLADELVTYTAPDGSMLVDLSGSTLADEDVDAPPRLLGMWDNVLLAHADRSRLIPPEVRGTVIRRNGDVLPTVLVDGYVAGVWRAVEDGIEVTAFRRLAPSTWEGLAAEAAALQRFLAGRDPRVFSRFGHWWSSIEGSQTKVL